MEVKAKQLEYFMRGGDVKRYHTRVTIGQQTVAEHSHRVISILRFLTDDQLTLELLLAAHQHDIPELISGDMPYVAKRSFQQLDEAITEVEAQLSAEMGLAPLELTPDEEELLKQADMLEAAMYGIDQAAYGNTTIGMEIVVNVLKAFNGREVTGKVGDILQACENYLINRGLLKKQEDSANDG